MQNECPQAKYSKSLLFDGNKKYLRVLALAYFFYVAIRYGGAFMMGTI